MEALKSESFNNHLDRFNFTTDPDKNELISGGDDCVIKVFDLNSKTTKAIADSSEEIKAIAYSNNRLAFGQGNSLQLLSNFNSEKINPNDSLLLTNFNSPVRQICFNEKFNIIIAFSEDDDLHIVNLTTLNTYKYKSNHDGSLKSMRVSPDGDVLVTTGCDGFLTVCEFIEDGKIQIKKKYKISQKVSIESPQQLTIDINNSNVCAISGNVLFRSLKLDKANLDILSIDNDPGISCRSDISLVNWINNTMIALVDLSNQAKIWNVSTKNCIFEISFTNSIVNSTVLLKSDYAVLIFGDNSGNVNIIQKIELTENTVEEDTNKVKISKSLLRKEKSEVDDFLNDFIQNVEKEGIIEQFEMNDKEPEEPKVAEKAPIDKDDEEMLALSDVENIDGELNDPEEIAQSIFHN